MSRWLRCTSAFVVVILAILSLSAAADAQRRAVPRSPKPPAHTVILRGHVFIGGYFYDPLFGPYPWWPRTAYRYWYFPVYDRRADLRVKVTPDDAAVYVDGFYAGIVDDFDGTFESLALPPGGHSIVLYREGYRTIRHNIYLRPASTFTLRDIMERLPVGKRSEPPPLAPPVPPPPPGSYRTPRTPPPSSVAPSSETAVPAAEAAGFGTLDLRVQPASADVAIDGERWVSSDEGRFAVQVPAGRHHVEISKTGYRTFATDIDVPEGQTVPLSVSLMAGAGKS